MESSSSGPLIAPSIDKLKHVLSQEPALFTWHDEPDHTAGVGRWSFMDIWPDRVELAAIFPPEHRTIATHNAQLIQLVLVALRPQWITAGDWLAGQLRMAARARTVHESTNLDRRVTFRWNREHWKVVLTIAIDD